MAVANAHERVLEAADFVCPRDRDEGVAQVLEAFLDLAYMIDVRAARSDPETFRAAVARKGAAEAFDELMRRDALWRELETQVTEMRAKTKTKGKPTAWSSSRSSAA